MGCFTIDSSFTPSEIFRLPLTNGFHIAVPVPGPVVAIIEGIATAIDSMVAEIKKIVDAVFSKPKVLEARPGQPVDGWKEAFKEKALSHFKTVQEKGKIEKKPLKLELTDEQRVVLHKAVELAGKTNERELRKIATLHGRNDVWVFSLKEIPGWVFKVSQHSNGHIENRFAETQKAKQVIEEKKLTFLHTPHQEIGECTCNGKVVHYLAEEKCEIFAGFSRQEALFQYCMNDKELQPVIQEYVRQLIILILETGYRDVRHDNNPILLNGQGIALIDVDTSDSPITGLCSGCAGTAEEGILWSLTPELIETFEPLLQSKLTAEQFQRVKEVKAALSAEKEKLPAFMQFLEKNNVKRGFETVEWQPSIFKDKKIEKLQNTINAHAIGNLGIAREVERKCLIWSLPNEEMLNRLKAQEKIFDWRRPKSKNGYFVWA